MKILEKLVGIATLCVLTLALGGCFHEAEYESVEEQFAQSYFAVTWNKLHGSSGGGGLPSGKSVSFDGNLNLLVSAETLERLSVTALTIQVANFAYDGTEDWWASIDCTSDWSDGAITLAWDDSIKGYSTTISDSTVLAKYTAGGLYLAGLSGATATVTVTDSSGTSSSDNAITLPYTVEYTGTGANDLLLAASTFSSLDSSGTVTVSFAWVSGSGGGLAFGAESEWPDLDWTNNNVLFSGTALAALKSSGLTVYLASGDVYTITVAYTD